MSNNWTAPGFATHIPIRKPACFDEMVEASRNMTEALINEGYSRDDLRTRDMSWLASSDVLAAEK